jgi:hypothetical protein
MKPLHLAAIIATFLLVVSAVNALMRPPPHLEAAKKKKTAPVKVAERCSIKRAVFGGAEAAVLKVRKDNQIHYVVLDLPTNNPLMPEYQSRWLDANYGEAQPDVIGVYPTVEDAISRAASLCTRN